jgi:hypothetical protein
MIKKTREDVVVMGARFRAGYLIEQFGYTMGLAQLDGDTIARHMPAGFMDRFQGHADAVSAARQNRTLLAAESKDSTQSVTDAVRLAKEWRRKVTAMGKKSAAFDNDVPDILTVMSKAKTVPEVIAQMEAMVKMLAARKDNLVCAELGDYIAEGESIVRTLKTADANQEVTHSKHLTDAVAEFYYQKGMLFQALKAVNEAGHELHYKHPVDSAKYNMSILYRHVGRKKHAKEDPAAK